MSNCMTIADEAIDQKEISLDITAKGVVEFILEEAVVAALRFVDKGCSRIGDFNITEDFCQQFDQIPAFSKDFDLNAGNQNIPSGTNQELKLDSGESIDRSISLLTARENLELILDTFIKPKEERLKSLNESKVIKEDILANNELRIENGQIRLEKTGLDEPVKYHFDTSRLNYLEREDVIRDEKIEIEYFTKGKKGKIYVPYTSGTVDFEVSNCTEEGNNEVVTAEGLEGLTAEPVENTFAKCTTEELRQLNTDPVSLIQFDKILSEASIDPNMPRACAFAEEDVNKMTKEIEEINLNLNHLTVDAFPVFHRSEGKGDADLESQSVNFEISSRNKNMASKILESSYQSKCLSAGSSKETFEERDTMGNKNDSPSKKDYSLRLEETREPDPVSTVQVDNKKRQSSATIFDNNIPEEDEKDETLEPDSIERHDVKPEYGASGGETLTEAFLSRKNSTTNENVSESIREDGAEMRNDHLCQRQTFPDLITPPELCILLEKTNAYHEKIYTASDKNINENENQEIVISPSDKFDGKLKRSQSGGRETETAVREGRLCSGKGIYNLKGSQSANNAGDNGQIPQTANNLTWIKTDNPNDGFFSLEKEVETSLTESNSFLENNNRSNFLGSEVLTKMSLFSSKGGKDEVIEVEKISDLSDRGVSLLPNDPLSTTGEFSQPESTQESIPVPAHGSEKQIGNRSSGEPAAKEDKRNDVTTGTEEATTSQSDTFEENKKEENNSPNSMDDSHQTSTCRNYLLQSKKKYLVAKFSQSKTGIQVEPVLTNSKESDIDYVENVIQIIEPGESSNEDDCESISFSLLNEIVAEEHTSKSALLPIPAESAENVNLELEEQDPKRKVYSGMTTIGPIKNVDHDPKDLTLSNVDYGKMTQVTSSSGQSEHCLPLRSPSFFEITNGESDDDVTMVVEGEPVQVGSIVNRDIASLTKVQKVREVMSYHPKPEEDFEEDSTLNRPRLDLKDVESMTDERYKVPDVNIPLLSFEVGDNNLEVNKELVESMHLMLNGTCFNDAEYYPNECATDEFNKQIDNSNLVMSVQNSNHEQIDKETFSNQKLRHSANRRVSSEETTSTENGNNKEQAQGLEKKSQFDDISKNQKYGTLGSVLRKASSRFNRKDSDIFLRTSKSLPRDTSKLMASESIKSILEDCHSSATNLLQKSRSLLKNTQTMLKSLSHSRFASETFPDSPTTLDQHKFSPSESDVRNVVEKKVLPFLRKEDFVKVKNIAKKQIERTLKIKSNSAAGSESIESLNKKDEENRLIDRTDNLKKLLPKSPLVYKSQFVRSQLNIQQGGSRNSDLNVCELKENFQSQQESLAKKSSISLASANSFEEEHVIVQFEPQKSVGKLHQLGKKETQLGVNAGEHGRREEEKQPEDIQPEFIVLETVRGLPTPDSGSPRSPITEEKSVKKIFPQKTKDNNQVIENKSNVDLLSTDVYVESLKPPELQERKPPDVDQTDSEKKVKYNKRKKLTARLRNFWCSTFGRMKTSSDKGDQR